jgi:hypothetical protein
MAEKNSRFVYIEEPIVKNVTGPFMECTGSDFIYNSNPVLVPTSEESETRDIWRELVTSPKSQQGYSSMIGEPNKSNN